MSAYVKRAAVREVIKIFILTLLSVFGIVIVSARSVPFVTFSETSLLPHVKYSDDIRLTYKVEGQVISISPNISGNTQVIGIAAEVRCFLFECEPVSPSGYYVYKTHDQMLISSTPLDRRPITLDSVKLSDLYGSSAKHNSSFSLKLRFLQKNKKINVNPEFVPVIIRYKILYRKNNQFFYSTGDLKIPISQLPLEDLGITIVESNISQSSLGTSYDRVFLSSTLEDSRFALECPLNFVCLFENEQLVDNNTAFIRENTLYLSDPNKKALKHLVVYEYNTTEIAYHIVDFEKSSCSIEPAKTSGTFWVYAKTQKDVTRMIVLAEAAKGDLYKVVERKEFKVEKDSSILKEVRFNTDKLDRISVLFYAKDVFVDQCVKDLKQPSSSEKTNNSFLRLILPSVQAKESENVGTNITNDYAPILMNSPIIYKVMYAKSVYKWYYEFFDPDKDLLTFWVDNKPEWVKIRAYSRAPGHIKLELLAYPVKKEKAQFSINISDAKHLVNIPLEFDVETEGQISSISLLPLDKDILAKGDVLRVRWNCPDCKRQFLHVYITSNPLLPKEFKHIGDVDSSIGEYTFSTKELKPGIYHVVLAEFRDNMILRYLVSDRFMVIESTDNPAGNTFMTFQLITPPIEELPNQISNVRFLFRMYASKDAVLSTQKIKAFLDYHDISDLVVYSKELGDYVTGIVELNNLAKGNHSLTFFAKDSKNKLLVYTLRFTVVIPGTILEKPVEVLDNGIAVGSLFLTFNQAKWVLGGIIFLVFSFFLPIITYSIESKGKARHKSPTYEGMDTPQAKGFKTPIQGVKSHNTLDSLDDFGQTLNIGDEIILD